MRYTLTIGLLTVLPGTALAQQTLTLKTPDAELEEPFTRIMAVRELANGKVYVSDLQDKSVVLADLGGNTMSKVGREGNGPGEYALPTSLLALPNDGTLLQDMLNRRFLHLMPDGKPGDFLMQPTPPQPANGGGGGAGGIRINGGSLLGSISSPRGTDNQGRIYFQGLSLSRDGSGPDSVPIMRWDRVKPSFDTVAFIKVPKSSTQVTRASGGGGANFSIRMGGSNQAWPAADQWQVLPDGRIAIVSPEPYRVTLLSGRARTTGSAVPFAPIRVTEAEKKAYREAQSRTQRSGVMITMGPGGSRTTTTNAPVTLPNADEIEFPETMPPFTGANAILATPDGQIWVLRTRKATDKNPTYDIFDGTGRLTGQAVLNPDSRVVGFGKGTVYVVRTDEDDLQYLQRFRR